MTAHPHNLNLLSPFLPFPHLTVHLPHLWPPLFSPPLPIALLHIFPLCTLFCSYIVYITCNYKQSPIYIFSALQEPHEEAILNTKHVQIGLRYGKLREIAGISALGCRGGILTIFE